MDAVVGLGANLGDRRGALVAAAFALSRRCTLRAASSVYETAPIGPPQPAYLNAAVRVTYEGSARELLETLLGIERQLGRLRQESDPRWGPRRIDLDLLFIDGSAVVEAGLVVPHPRLHERRFALVPLLDVAPDARHPVTGEPLRVWLAVLPEQGVHRVALPDWCGHVAPS